MVVGISSTIVGSGCREVDNPVTKETAAAISGSIGILRAGAELREVRLSSLAEYSAANRIIMNAEATAYHEQALKARFLDFGERLRHRLLLASLLRSNDYIQAQRRRHELRDFAQTMEEFDVLITAGAASEAPRMDEDPFWNGLEKPSFTLPWNLPLSSAWVSGRKSFPFGADRRQAV